MKKTRVFVAGHNGMVGSALVHFLKKKKGIEIITKNRKDLNLTNQLEVQDFFKNKKIDQIFIAAGKVGGIKANILKPGEFIYENLMIQTNIIHAAFLNKIKKLLYISSSCVYPKFSKQPIKEEALLGGTLEKSVEPYAISKIAGIKLCEAYNNQFSKKYMIDYRSIVPNNLYGPGDNYDLENSHVVAALLRKFHDAKEKKKSEVVVWGNGKPLREFLYLDDFINSCFFMMNIDKKFLKKKIDSSYVNVGSGKEISIIELALMIKKIVKFNGLIKFDTSKPNGALRKFLNTSKIRKLGWKPKVSLFKGLSKTYKNFKNTTLEC
ncbi:GDP-L-fucose synthase [Candidatus Pelagibacter sp.]|nr:GDP-L-fucose synthase [Candidatus Pelagibacter sp.]